MLIEQLTIYFENCTGYLGVQEMFTFIIQLNLMNWHSAVLLILFQSVSNGLGIVFFKNANYFNF